MTNGTGKPNATSGATGNNQTNGTTGTIGVNGSSTTNLTGIGGKETNGSTGTSGKNATAGTNGSAVINPANKPTSFLNNLDNGINNWIYGNINPQTYYAEVNK